MNRRQVLFGAAATAVACRGFVPWAGAQSLGGAAVSMSVIFQPFTLGIRGTYTLNGAATLIGVIPPIGLGAATGGAASAAMERAIVPGASASTSSAAPGATAAAVPAPGPIATAPLPPATMSIVRVPRGSAGRELQAAH